MSVSPEPRPGPRELFGPLHSDEIVIGLALGSPREQEEFAQYSLPLPQQQDYDRREQSLFFLQPSQSEASASSSRPDGALKRNASRWKGLGNLFARKTSSNPVLDGQPFYMLDPAYRHEPANPKRTPESPNQTSTPNRRRRANTNQEVATENLYSAQPALEGGAKAILRRASTRKRGLRRKKIEEVRTNRPRAQTGPTLPSRRDLSAERLEKRNEVNLRAATSAPWLPLSGHAKSKKQEWQNVPLLIQPSEVDRNRKNQAAPTSLLKVDIPNVELERYSVMFGDLLYPQKSQTTPKLGSRRQSCSPRRKSQVAERRLAASDKENPHKSPLASNPPRPMHGRTHSSSSSASKSSKSSTKSTATFSLFPPTADSQKRNTARKPPPKPSPLSRSVSTPVITVAPPRPAGHTSNSQGPKHVMIIVHEPEPEPEPEQDPEPQSSPRVPLSVIENQQQDISNHDMSKASAIADEYSTAEDFDHSSENDHPEFRPLTANDADQGPPMKHMFPVRKSSMKAPRAPLRTYSSPSPPLQPLKTDSLSSEGEIASFSVARQVSISRRQRSLVPIEVKLVAASTTA